MGSSPWRRAGRGHRRRLEHRAPARRARRAAGPLASGRCCGSARTSSATAGSPNGSSRRQPRSSRGYAEDARSAGVEELEVLITSPGRQAANGDELLEVLALAARCPVRVLSSAEEGRLAFVGAVGLATPPPRRTVAVVDVGGGSAQVVVGTRRDGPSWQQSIDLGSQRLTSRLLTDEPPGERAVRRASAEVARYLTGLVPPAAAHGLRGRRQRPCAEADRRPAARSRRARVPARSRRLDAGRGARRALRHRRRADANGRRRARSSSPPSSSCSTRR